MGDDVNTAEAEDIDPKAERLEACFTIASILQLLEPALQLQKGSN